MRNGVALTLVPIRDTVLRRKASRSSLIGSVAASYRSNKCDGLFLSPMSHDGVQLPMSQLLSAIRASAQINFAVVDAAQEFAHVPVNLSATICDFYLTGCHKWLGAHQPLGIALLPNEQTAHDVLQFITQGCVDDPLLRFLHYLDHRCGSLETVNLAPLFSAWGALIDFHRRRDSLPKRFQSRLSNARRVCHLARSLGWTPLRPPTNLCSGIVLLQSRQPAIRQIPSDHLQRLIDAAGVVLSAYESGLVRLSLPDRPLGARQLALLGSAIDSQRLQAYCLPHSLEPKPVNLNAGQM